MTRLWMAAVALAALAPLAHAKNPRVLDEESTGQMSLGELTPTPSMWLYQQQLAEYKDPQAAVRRRAEYIAAQRDQRIAARKWYGFSNSRPRANGTPFMGTYSPAWVGTINEPFQWPGSAGAPTIIIEQPRSDYVR